jgi:hypothetical protein
MDMTGTCAIPLRRLLVIVSLPFFLLSLARAEECRMGSDLDPATKSALESTAQRYYQMAASGNASALQQSSIPSVASNFGGIQSALQEHKDDFGSSAKVRGIYELNAPGTAPLARAEFFCGIFNSPDRVAFVIPNLPPGSYAVAILDAQGGKTPLALSFVLQQDSGQWKLAGFYARPSSIAGHDANWYLAQARAFKAKGQNHNAWLYYLAAWDLSAPVPFMSTAALDKIGEEAQPVRPPDMPNPEQPLQLASAGGKTYKVTQLFAVPVTDGLGLVMKYQVPDISNSTQTFQDNMAVMKDLLAKYPELRDGFTSIVARAVAPSGQDYGTLLAMKDVK